MNLTDVDDKTIRGAREHGIPLADFTKPFKDAFFEDLATLRIKPANAFPAATDPEHIARMIAMIAQLIAAGHAYQADDQSVYFRIASFPNYGKLAHLNLDELRPSGRVSSDEYEKENIGDFALWKAHDAADGDVKWDSPWGPGRPGWHIECSAMSMRLLGSSFDMHLGGEDLVFPHHEDEIAQSDGAGLQEPGQPFVKYLVHASHLLVEGKKMSKSLGNFYTLRDLQAKGFDGREIRYVLLSANYRASLNFTLESLNGARTALARLDECLGKLEELRGGETAPAPDLLDAFRQAMDDDLNISAAWGCVFDWVREANRRLSENAVSP